MSSIRVKLILVVTLITVSSFVTVVFSNLQLIKKDKEAALSRSNFQVSELVTRSVVTQMNEYRRGLQYITKTILSDASFAIEPNYFPDYLWVLVLDWNGRVVYEWNHEEKIKSAGLEVTRLLGKKNQDSLFQEVKQVLSLRGDWFLFNSTVDPMFPSFLFASAYKPSDSERPTHVILAEIDSEPLFDQIHPRRGQTLTLIDSHENVLYSTREGWNPAEIAFKDEKVIDLIKSIEKGKQEIQTVSYDRREAQLTWVQKFEEGEGLTLVLQEPVSLLAEGASRIQWQSAIVGLIILVIAVNLIILIGGRLTKPLVMLTQMMQKVGRGEFTGRIKVKTKDEIGKLAAVFNKCCKNLMIAKKKSSGRNKSLSSPKKCLHSARCRRELPMK